MSVAQQFLQPMLGGGNVPFVGFLDAGSNVEHVYLLFRALSSYTGPLIRLLRDSDNAESDFSYVSNSDENLDVSAITTWAGGAGLELVTIYDQKNGDDVDYTTNRPTFNLADATANNKPTFTLAGLAADALRGTYTNGGTMSQPNTFFAAAALAETSAQRMIIDGDDTTNRNLMYRRTPGNNWAIHAGTAQQVAKAVPTDWIIHIGLFAGGDSKYWQNGASPLIEANPGAASVDGITIGASAVDTYGWNGPMIGAIAIDGNSSDTDKNIIGNKFKDFYGFTYTNI